MQLTSRALSPSFSSKILASACRPLLAFGGKADARRSSTAMGALSADTISDSTRWDVETATAPNTTAKNYKLGIYVNSHFDSGNIEVNDISDPSNVQLAIHKDPYCDTDGREHFQWFHFRMTGVRDVPLTLRITNAGQASYPEAWHGYKACASYDLVDWFRVPTEYDAETGVLSIKHSPTRDAVHYAYFAPYTYERHTQLVHRMQNKDNVRLLVVGETLDDHDLDLLQVGEPGPGKRNIWVVARQHPGESQAEWFVEGLLERLTDKHDATARQLLQTTVFYVIPNMNPDGTWRGHLRTNAAGVNLNRAWQEPDLATSPEVFHTLQSMEALGVDAFIDVHGDEELPYVFIAGNDGIPNFSSQQQQLQDSFLTAFCRASPDFQTQFGYPRDAPGQANLRLGSKFVGHKWGCLSVTLEMPFKDNANLPDERQGWSPERSMRLGGAILNAINEVVPLLA